MIWEIITNILKIGKEVVDSEAIPWLTNLVGDLGDKREEALDLVRPYFAEANALLADEGLLGAAVRLVGGEDLPEQVVDRIYEIRRPFMARATSVLQAAGFEQRS